MTTYTPPSAVVIPCFNHAGPVQIWTNTGVAGIFQYLGETRNGVTISQRRMNVDLKSDSSGGESGIPADFQWLGDIHEVELDLSRYNEAVLALIEQGINATTQTLGELINCAGASYKVIIIGTNFGRAYTKAFVNEPIQRAPIGMPVMYPRVTFTCLGDPLNVGSSVSSGQHNSPYNYAPWSSDITTNSSSAYMST